MQEHSPDTFAANGASRAAWDRESLLSHTILQATWELELTTGELSCSPAVASMFGYTPSDIEGGNAWWRDRLHPDDRDRVERTFDQALLSGASTWSSKYRVRCKDGSWLCVVGHAVFERDLADHAVRALGVTIDASEFQETDERLKLFTEQIPARACGTDRDLRVVCDLGAGFPDSPSPLGKTVMELFAQSPDRERVLEGCHKALAGESCELDIDSGQSAAQLHLVPLRDRAGDVSGVIGLAVDVTERVRVEQALRATQRLLLDAHRIGRMWAWEEDVRTGMVNADLATPQGRGDVGYQPRPRDEAWKAIHPDDLSRLNELRRKTIETGGPFETEYRQIGPDGQERIVMVRGEMVRDEAGRPERILGTALDITERKRAEANAQVVLDTLPVGLQVLDRAANIIASNPASRRIWGDVIVGQERYERGVAFWHDSGKRITLEEWASQRALNRGETSLNELIDFVSFDGQHKTMRNSVAPMRDEQGQIIGAVVVNEDVTEQVRAEDALRKNQRLLVEAQSLGRVGSWEEDLVTGEVQSSAENQRLHFGEGGRGEKFEDYAAAIHPDDLAWMMQRRAQLLKGVPADIEYRVVWPDGSVHWLFGRRTVLRDEQGRPVRIHGINADITDRKRAEEELGRRERQQAALAQLSHSALKGDGIQPLFEEASELVARTLGVDRGLVGEWVPEEGLVRVRASYGRWHAEEMQNMTSSTSPGLMSWFYMRSQTPVIVEDLPSETRFAPCEVLMKLGVKSTIAVRIGGRERPFGVLEVNTKTLRRFTQDEVNFVWSMASVLATCIEQRRMASELRDERERLKELSKRLLDAQEAERRAIARELHDDFGAMLSALKLNLQNERPGPNALEENLSLVDHAIQQVRDLATDLRPSILDDLGLVEALSWYADREARRAGFGLRLNVDKIDVKVPTMLETACFRIVQEALTNAIRHSGARSVELELHENAGALRVCLRDDGKGFDVAALRRAAAAGKSHGLLNMQERAELAGGELEIESAPARGTMIRATFRISQERDE